MVADGSLRGLLRTSTLYILQTLHIPSTASPSHLLCLIVLKMILFERLSLR